MQWKYNGFSSVPVNTKTKETSIKYPKWKVFRVLRIIVSLRNNHYLVQNGNGNKNI